MTADDYIARLRSVLLAGGVALVPTDTVYGVAAALDVPAGVESLYALKGRARSQPCQVLVYSPDLLERVAAELDDATGRAVRALLPGTTTCIVPDPAGRFAAAAGEAVGAVGLRAPAVAGPLTSLDIPLVATSANDPGGRDPSRIEEVPGAIRDGVDATLDAGELPGTASAVVDLCDVAAGHAATLIRPGPDPEGLRRRLAQLGIDLREPD